MLPEEFEYRGPPKRCAYCGEEFVPNMYRQIYCNTRCNDKAKYERRQKLRAAKGLCPQCGGEMIPGEIFKTGRSAGERPTYCRKCQKYFKERWEKKKELGSNA